MSTQTKPEPSYASTRLTPRNYQGGAHLLSVFNKNEQIKSSKKEKRREPRVDEAPIGSSDEEEGEQDIDLSDIEGDEEKRVTAAAKPTLDAKFTGNDTTALRRSSRMPPISKDNGDSLELSSSQEKRPSSAMDGQPKKEHEKEYSFDLWGSQQAKRRKMTQFTSRRRSSNKASAPSSSAPSSTSKTKSTSNSRKSGNKADKSPQEKKSSFQMPREIDIPNSFKAHATVNTGPSTHFDDILGISSEDDGSPLSSPADTPSPPSSAFDYELSQADNALPAKNDQETWQSGPAFCPVCNQGVDPEALMRFEAQSEQRLQHQFKFCESHQAVSAEKEWNNKGYPIIDWDMFDERIRDHFTDLEQFLIPENSSYYRNLLDSDMKAGKAKNFRLTLSGDGLENISCGYYGTRGSGKMLQAVTTHFSQKLRRLAAVDHIAKTAGVAGYAQAVLVPELAVRLVKEDMKVNDESARQILRDSIRIGEKLNPQLDDIVPVPEELEENPETTAI